MEQNRDVPRRTFLQLYTPSFSPDGFAGLQSRGRYIRTLGVGQVVVAPANLYRRESNDGPYSPLDHAKVDHGLGGEKSLVEVNDSLKRAGISPVGDLVACHADEYSDIVQRALRDPERWSKWLRVTDDPQGHGWDHLTNIFDLEPMVPCPELGGWRATPFYGDQWSLNAADPEVVAYICDVAERMIRVWGYRGLRLDAIAHIAGLDLPVFMHRADGVVRNPADPVALRLARAIQERLKKIEFPDGTRPFTIAEAGGTQRDIAQWLDVLDYAYDFTWMPTLLQCLDTADWTPLRDLWAAQPLVKGSWIRYLGSHDQRDFRYSPYCGDLLRRHGGLQGEFTCYGNTGVTPRVRDLLVGEDPMVMLLGVTILADGVPLLYQGDAECYGGTRKLNHRDPRNENRCAMPWDSGLPQAGWPEDAPYPLEPTWKQRSIQTQLEDPNSPLRRVLRWIAVRDASDAVQCGERFEVKVSPAEERRRVIAFARMSPDTEEAVIAVANASTYPQTVHLDLSQLPHKLLRRLITNPGAYLPGSPTLLWQDVSSWGAQHEVRAHLNPHELAVFQAY